MPRYYFDMADGAASRDEHGLEFDDEGAARDAAMRSLIEYALDAHLLGEISQTVTICVSDARRTAFYTATLSLDGRSLAP